jgi:hypothetical protein
MKNSMEEEQSDVAKITSEGTPSLLLNIRECRRLPKDRDIWR